MPHGASRRLRALNAVMRYVAKPRLRATPGPKEARKDFELFARTLLPRPEFLLRQVSEGEPPIHWVRCGSIPRRPEVILYFHGGAYIAGSPRTHQGLAGRLSRLTGLEVAMPVYRLAPQHPAPAAYEDAVAAWERLLIAGRRPDEIVLAGDSAGAGIALALLSKLCGEGTPPRGIVAFSPWVDLTFSGQSFRTNAKLDPLLPIDRAAEVADYVCQNVPPHDPRVSPLNARFAAPPPAMIHVGNQEILRDDAVRMAALLRRSGGDVTLLQKDGLPHAWPLFDGWIPEARETLQEAATFIAGLEAKSRPIGS